MIRRQWLFLSCVPLSACAWSRTLSNSDSSSTLAQEVMRTHVCAQNFGHHYQFEEIEVIGFPNVSGLHVRSCLHESLCFVPYIFDNLNCIHALL
jgi:hypothetical protein